MKLATVMAFCMLVALGSCCAELVAKDGNAILGSLQRMSNDVYVILFSFEG